MQKSVIILFIILIFFISSCSSLKSDKSMLSSLEKKCLEQNKVWVFDSLIKKGSCVTPLLDAGKRCTKTLDCEGFCEGSNASTSSGKCSATNKPDGCAFFVERGARFWRCPK